MKLEISSAECHAVGLVTGVWFQGEEPNGFGDYIGQSTENWAGASIGDVKKRVII